jgi:predicted nucleic acid-binding protein
MVILELAGGTRTEAEYRTLTDDFEALQQFPITESVWRSAYRIAHTLQRKGLSIPATDQLIASVTLSYPCRLLHRDRHFDLMARHIELPIWKP